MRTTCVMSSCAVAAENTRGAQSNRRGCHPAGTLSNALCIE
jgi:hypothetical protein